jgi:hypothetical protein
MVTLTELCWRRLSEIDRLERAFEENPSPEVAKEIKHLWVNWNHYRWGNHTHEGPSREKVNAIIRVYDMITQIYFQDNIIYSKKQPQNL